MGDFTKEPSSRLLKAAAHRCEHGPTQVRLLLASTLLDVPPPAPLPARWELTPGMRVRVKQEITDFDVQVIPAGTELTFRHGNYFPYDGGHTWEFEGWAIRLAGIANQDDIIGNRDGAWLETLDASTHLGHG